MSRFLLCSMLAILFGSINPARGEDAKRDADKLQGTWEAAEGVSNGKAIPKDLVKGFKVVFSGEKMSIFPVDGDGKQAKEHTFKLDPGKKPKAMDATRLDGASKGKMAKAIYELDGDTLKLCLPSRLDLDHERPTEFAAPEKSRLVLLTLKRVKK